MANEPVKVNVQSRRVDSSIIPNNFSQPYRQYIIQQNTDMFNIANGANNASELAYEATVKNDEQDVELADHELRISQLWVEVDDHEIRITANTSAINGLDIRLTTAEGDIVSLQTDLSNLATRVSSAETDIDNLQADYVSKTVTTSQSLASPLNVTTSYSVGGTKVIGARQAGWTAGTGTSLVGSFNANQAYTVSSTYTQTEVSAIATGLLQARQRILALESALRTHGLIN